MFLPRLGGSRVTKSSLSAAGSYILTVRLKTASTIEVGSLGKRDFPAGYYAYVGSAMGGFKARLGRHIRKNKTPRWHIDYLTNKGNISSVVIFESTQRDECRISELLGSRFARVSGFGSSDCDCASHLFYAPGEAEMKAGVEKIASLVPRPSKILDIKDIPSYLGLSRRFQNKGIGHENPS